MEFTGKITRVFQRREGTSMRTGQPWASQTFLIQEEGKNFNQSLTFDVFGIDRLSNFNLQEGEVVTVKLDFSTRDWQDRTFTQINCYDVVRGQTQPVQGAPAQQAQQQPQQASAAQQPAQQAAPAAAPSNASNDDLPF